MYIRRLNAGLYFHLKSQDSIFSFGDHSYVKSEFLNLGVIAKFCYYYLAILGKLINLWSPEMILNCRFFNGFMGDKVS